MSRLFFLSMVSLFTCCYSDNNNKSASAGENFNQPDSLNIVADIAPPPGYKRMNLAKTSFGEWLKNITLKKDNHVYLYNGTLKRNQSAQFAVLDITVGNKDLQQCADALMRLRAEYLFSQKRYSEINFRDNSNRSYKWTGGPDKTGLDKYFEKVFSMCGSASLEKQLKPVTLADMQPGDVFIRGGFPGHAMIVIDVAKNEKGQKVFMLAQSYMPAQDIHIVKNPADSKISPWYEVNDETEILTPEWTFLDNQLRRW
ncbi:MAG: hypothetical protein E6H09_10270 [Bacteroidetes bacterium]|nr:MAG: hypothetical protein E6H09_10270 [Bacteroidota bacterium]